MMSVRLAPPLHAGLRERLEFGATGKCGAALQHSLYTLCLYVSASDMMSTSGDLLCL